MTKLAGLVVIGQPRHRRTQLLQAAMQARGLNPAATIDWFDLLRDPIEVATRLHADPERPVKIDSPGESAELEDRLIRHGWGCLGEPGAPPQSLTHGELAHRHLWYAGFADVLRRLDAAASMIGRFNTHWLNTPQDILLMCDKLEAQSHLIAASVETPLMLGSIDHYDHLQERMRDADIDRVFVKARYGSSAAGVVAYRRHRDGREVAYSSAELAPGAKRMRLFNSLRPRRYADRRDIAALIDAVAAQSAYAETWIAKPRTPGDRRMHFDLRMVTFAGQPRQRVARIATQPMTNLHLGNRRDAAERVLDAPALSRTEDVARRAASVFADSASIGFDLIPTAHGAVVLEANAFGDLLPDLRWRGMSAYDDQAAWCASFVAPSRLDTDRSRIGRDARVEEAPVDG